MLNICRSEKVDRDISIDDIASLASELFQTYEGVLYVGGPSEVLMLIKTDKKKQPGAFASEIKFHLPLGSCDVDIVPSMSNGIMKVQINISPTPSQRISRMFRLRTSRRENVVIVADDDMYIRSIISKGISDIAKVVEVSSGIGVVESYREYNPDLVFLDYHLPGKDGENVLRELFELDTDACIIMISADSSAENVRETRHKGAKTFLAKPFTRDRLLECIRKCPTMF